MLDTVLKSLNVGKIPPSQYSPLTLAYIGDCVYELYIRTYLMKDANRHVNELHKRASKLVCCGAQAKFFEKMKPLLSDEELNIYKRGRNTNSRVPKNSSMSDYRSATGLEALMGYLYLSNRSERICELLKYALADLNK